MMDRERQERDIQEVFGTSQEALWAAIENTFALQERTLEFAGGLIEASTRASRTQAERATVRRLSRWPNSPGPSGKPWRTWLGSLPRSTRACSGPPSPMGSTTPSSRRLRRHPK